MKNKGGRRTLLDSFCDAFRGVWDCVKSERNMRVHLAACCYVLFFAVRMNLDRGEFACLFLAIGSVMAAETMNTAVEKLCDFEEKRFSPQIRVIKDLAAGAVVLTALAAAGVGLAVFLRPELLQTVKGLFSDPPAAVLFLLSAVLAVAFILAGPGKIGEFFQKRGKKP